MAWTLLKGLLALAPASLPRAEAIGIGGPVLWFTLALSLATGLLFGLVPALHGTRMDLQGRLKDRTATAQSSGGLLRSGLVVAEVALAVVVLVGAGLLLRSFWQLQLVNPGFRTDGLLTMQLSPSEEAYATGAGLVNFYRRVQGAGKIVHIELPAANVEPLVRQLDPSLLCLHTWCATPAEADALLADACQWTR
jgi:hypothetical protein